MNELTADLKRYKKNGYRVLLLSGSRTRAKRLAEDLQEEGLASFYSEDANREVLPGEVGPRRKRRSAGGSLRGRRSRILRS